MIRSLHFKTFDRTKPLHNIKLISKCNQMHLWWWQDCLWPFRWMRIKSFDRCFPRSDGNSDNVNSIVHYIDGINMSPRMTLNDVIFRIGHRDVVTICPVAFFIIDGLNLWKQTCLTRVSCKAWLVTFGSKVHHKELFDVIIINIPNNLHPIMKDSIIVWKLGR